MLGFDVAMYEKFLPFARHIRKCSPILPPSGSVFTGFRSEPDYRGLTTCIFSLLLDLPRFNLLGILPNESKLLYWVANEGS